MLSIISKSFCLRSCWTLEISSLARPSSTSSSVRAVSRMVNTLFSMATAKPSLALILMSRKSLVISTSSPSRERTAFPFLSTEAMNSAAFTLARAAPKAFILAPSTGPAALKLGFSEKFIYLSRSFSNTTSLTFSSSMMSGVRSLIRDSYFPSTMTSLRGCLTLIFSFSLVPRPRVARVLTRSILSSTFLSTRLISALGKYAVWTVASPVRFT